MSSDDLPIVVVGAGYAGLTLAVELTHRTAGHRPVVLVGRRKVHVLRTELYQIGRLAARRGDDRHWAVPIVRALGSRGPVRFKLGEVEAIDLAERCVRLDGNDLPYRSLAICLGNVPAYYGVPGAEQNLHQVYGLAAARRLAGALRAARPGIADRATGAGLRVVVVGGGSTGTEVSAEIATTDWARLWGRVAHSPEVTLVCGAQPFLAGLPEPLVRRARRFLEAAGVVLDEGRNVTHVEPGRLALRDGPTLPFDIGVWAAGTEAPKVVRDLPVPHGRAGRIAVEATLAVPGSPGAFALGDVAEHRDPRTGAVTPATARAAIAAAAVASENLVRELAGRPLRPFRFRERATLVSVGRGRAAGQVGDVPVWGRPAAVLKALVEAKYRAEVGAAAT